MISDLSVVSIYPRSGRFEVQATDRCSPVPFNLDSSNGLLAEIKSISTLEFRYDEDTDDRKQLLTPSLKITKIFPKLKTFENIDVFVQPSDFVSFIDEHTPKVVNWASFWVYQETPAKIDEDEEKLLVDWLQKGYKVLKSIDFVRYPLDRLWDRLKVYQLEWMSFSMKDKDELKRCFEQILDQGIPSANPNIKFRLDLYGQPKKGILSLIQPMLTGRVKYSIEGCDEDGVENFTLKLHLTKEKRLVVELGKDEGYDSAVISYQFNK